MSRVLCIGLTACSLVFHTSYSLAAETTQSLKLRNGDTISGVPIPEDSTETTQVLVHPQLGRIEIPVDAIAPPPAKKLWTTAVSAGLNANGKDGDTTVSGNIKVNSTYNNDIDTFNLKAGFNYSRSQDKGESAEIKTRKVMSEFVTTERCNRVLACMP